MTLDFVIVVDPVDFLDFAPVVVEICKLGFASKRSLSIVDIVGGHVDGEDKAARIESADACAALIMMRIYLALQTKSLKIRHYTKLLVCSMDHSATCQKITLSSWRYGCPATTIST